MQEKMQDDFKHVCEAKMGEARTHRVINRFSDIMKSDNVCCSDVRLKRASWQTVTRAQHGFRKRHPNARCAGRIVSKRASMQASTQARKQASKQASTQASKRECKQARTQASTQASKRARAQASEQTHGARRMVSGQRNVDDETSTLNL